MEEKKKSKKKKIIIIMLVIIVVIALLFLCLVPILQKQSIEKTKQEIEDYYNNEQYDLAMNLCDFISSKEDIRELQEKVATKYIQALEENGEYKQAYELLMKYNNIQIENQAEIKQNYMIALIEEDQQEQAIEMLKSTEGLTEENISKVIDKYIEKTIYPKAYNSLYQAMKNPSSLKVNNYSVSVWYYNTEDLSSGKSKASFTYNKEFPFFKAEITFNYSGTNSYGGVVTSKSKYVYWGKVNEDYRLSDIYLRWQF